MKPRKPLKRPNIISHLKASGWLELAEHMYLKGVTPDQALMLHGNFIHELVMIELGKIERARKVTNGKTA